MSIYPASHFRPYKRLSTPAPSGARRYTCAPFQSGVTCPGCHRLGRLYRRSNAEGMATVRMRVRMRVRVRVSELVYQIGFTTTF